MTPLDCARGLAGYLKGRFKEYSESAEGNESGAEKAVNVYAGFLPRASTRQEAKSMCPAVVLRPELIEDGKEDTRVTIIAYVTVYDEDMKYGSDRLYHLLEFMRFILLSENPVENKWQIADGMKTTIPDEQPYPQWFGMVEFDVFLPQPIWTSKNIL